MYIYIISYYNLNPYEVDEKTASYYSRDCTAATTPAIFAVRTQWIAWSETQQVSSRPPQGEAEGNNQTVNSAGAHFSRPRSPRS